MKYQTQLHSHLPDLGIFGDCFRTCIANLLDLEVREVPHFYQEEYDGGYADGSDYESDWVKEYIDSWLAERGLQLFRMPVSGEASLETIALQIETLNGRVLYMVQGKSAATGGNHVVIYKGADLLWDPSYSQKGISGPGSDGIYWLMFLMPLSQRWDGCLPGS